MTHLLAISVGPVQEFIAAARRTRDLWFGSFLLSEVSKAVARAVSKNSGDLIFPHRESDLCAESSLNVANVIMAEIASDHPEEIAAEAKRAAQRRWKTFADEARAEASDVIRTDIWDDQVGDVIEFYAAWVERTEDYRADRAAVMRLLAGRKNCRDFLPAAGRAGVPKSSLDGRRESVLKPAHDGSGCARRRLRIRAGEQLDVVGLVKRFAGGSRRYPSVARIACDPWVRANKEKPAFAALVAACRRLGREVIHRLNEEDFPQFKDFPFEGTAVYPSRHHEWLEETGLTNEDLKPLRDALGKLPEADPYLAVLVADGDRMGEAISKLHSPDEHRCFSKALAGFAGKAEQIVEAHQGVLIYAGGDDVLAFVPVDRCLGCARELSNSFATQMKTYGALTLSVGIAIGHFMENLEVLLDYGRAAEQHAKQPRPEDGSQSARNALAVHLHKRGGVPIAVRRQWSENMDDSLAGYAGMLGTGTIPAGLPYELKNMAAVYDAWPCDTETDKEKIDDAIRQDVMRLIAKKQPASGSVRAQLAGSLVDLNPARLRRLAEELLVARQLGRAVRHEE